MIEIEILQQCLSKWQATLRLPNWDIRLTPVDTEWRKTGDNKSSFVCLVLWL